VRKTCNPRNFKSHVSPHEFLQAVTQASKRQFTMTEQGDPVAFLAWLLNQLRARLGKAAGAVVTATFEGRLRVHTRKMPPNLSQLELEGRAAVDPHSPEFAEKTADTPFLVLPLDLPPPPLFADERAAAILPQVPLFELLNKFDGVTEQETKTYKDVFVKRFALLALPPVLLVHVQRFKKNSAFVMEKNPTIVHFPIRNIVLRDYLLHEDDRAAAGDHRYSLVANIVHESPPGDPRGTYHAHVYHKGANQWFDAQDLHVDSILPDMITLASSYLMIWERQPDEAQPVTLVGPDLALAPASAASHS
jgi:U4/U6.U5 tri-snRNP-associated protein 2